jgi:hypothetical protein
LRRQHTRAATVDRRGRGRHRNRREHRDGAPNEGASAGCTDFHQCVQSRAADESQYVASNPQGVNASLDAAGVGAALANFIGVLSCGQLADEASRDLDFHELAAVVLNVVSLLKQWQVINTTT